MKKIHNHLISFFLMMIDVNSDSDTFSDYIFFDSDLSSSSDEIPSFGDLTSLCHNSKSIFSESLPFCSPVPSPLPFLKESSYNSSFTLYDLSNKDLYSSERPQLIENSSIRSTSSDLKSDSLSESIHLTENTSLKPIHYTRNSTQYQNHVNEAKFVMRSKKRRISLNESSKMSDTQRERNRTAARRYREIKKQKQESLEKEVSSLKSKIDDLSHQNNELSKQNEVLKQKMSNNIDYTDTRADFKFPPLFSHGLSSLLVFSVVLFTIPFLMYDKNVETVHYHNSRLLMNYANVSISTEAPFEYSKASNNAFGTSSIFIPLSDELIEILAELTLRLNHFSFHRYIL